LQRPLRNVLMLSAPQVVASWHGSWLRGQHIPTARRFYPSGGHCFPDITGGVFWEEVVLH
jgi:hypothetical protein